MNDQDHERLRPIGFNHSIAQALTTLDGAGSAMRVLEVHRETVRVHDGGDEHSARLLPWLARALGGQDELATGDWVRAEFDEHGACWIGARMPPINQIARRTSAGSRQAIASNIDTALLVMGLDADFNLRRLERYVAMVRSAEVWPVIVLTKSDLAADTGAKLEALRARLPAESAIAVDARAAQTTVDIAPYTGAGQTLVVLGSSGAGKSTLTNTLVGRTVQDTGGVRADDSRGRHTTRSRSLHLLPAGACLIDTPGLRGLRPDTDEAGLGASFADIVALAGQCRFRDCDHIDEPGCAVRAGVPADRLLNYQKMLRDLRRDALTPLERRARLALWKARSRGAAERMKLKRG